MKRKFATNLILLLLLNLAIKPFWVFGIDRTVQNLVGASEYGLFFALFNFSLLLNIFLDFGLTNFNNRSISQHPQLLPRYLSNLVGIKLLMAIAYFVISITAAYFLGYSQRQLGMLMVLVVNQFLASFILYLRSNISGLQLFRTDSILSVTDRVFMILLCSVMIWGPLRSEFKIEWFIYAQTIAYLVTTAISLVIVVKKVNVFVPRINRIFLVSILKQSYPYALLVLLMSFHFRVDSVMIERLLPNGNFHAGIYAQAFRLLDVSTMVPFLFASLLLPIFSRMLKQGEQIISLLGFSVRLLFAASIVFSLVCIVYRDSIMELLYVNHTAESSAIFATLMVCFVFVSISYIFGTLLTANGSLYILNIIALVGVVVNIVLNVVLIPRHFALGAAVASLITQALVSLLQLGVAIKIFKLRVKKAEVIKFLSLFGVTYLAYFTVNQFSVHWVIGVVMVLIVSTITAFAVKLVSVKNLFAILLEGRGS
ncbi:MAG: polysaccharide biosynthesis C-terminal domain-containing protein [Tenuifilaceae bacterium]|nr:polysaccharide biosynthesis C-terminal domain-containing protein [Tenuifilaceae bacterium]